MSTSILSPATERTIRAAARAEAATWPDLTHEQAERLRALLSSPMRDTGNSNGGDRS